MRDDGVIYGVPRVFVSGVLAGNGIAHSVTEVDSGIAKTNSRKCGCQEHLRLGLDVIGVLHGTGEVFDGAAEGLHGEYIRDGIRALVRGAIDRVSRTGDALVERDSRP